MRMISAIAISAALGAAAPALAQTAMSGPPAAADPAGAGPATAADQAPQTQLTLDAAAGGAAGPQGPDANAAGGGLQVSDQNGVRLVTNGPVPDTPANRARFGQPMSHAGKRTQPSGN